MQPKRPSAPTGRDADPRRTIPLNSSAWRRLRGRVLAEEPLCRHCGAVATDVDHLSGDPSDNTRANLQPLCHACHSIKTGQERAGKTAKVRGCDVDGWPADPAHPFNEKSLASVVRKTVRQPSFYRYVRDRNA